MVDWNKAMNRKVFESAESASPVLTRLIAGVLSGHPETVFNYNKFFPMLFDKIGKFLVIQWLDTIKVNYSDIDFMLS